MLPLTPYSLEQWYSTFVRPRPGEVFLCKTRARYRTAARRLRNTGLDAKRIVKWPTHPPYTLQHTRLEIKAYIVARAKYKIIVRNIIEITYRNKFDFHSLYLCPFWSHVRHRSYRQAFGSYRLIFVTCIRRAVWCMGTGLLNVLLLL
jgi:hypothetical protein